MTGNALWRRVNVGTYTRKMFLKMFARAEKGIEKYGESFVGDPLDHLEEELLDGLFYVYMLRRKLDEERQ